MPPKIYSDLKGPFKGAGDLGLGNTSNVNGEEDVVREHLDALQFNKKYDELQSFAAAADGRGGTAAEWQRRMEEVERREQDLKERERTANLDMHSRFQGAIGVANPSRSSSSTAKNCQQ